VPTKTVTLMDFSCFYYLEGKATRGEAVLNVNFHKDFTAVHRGETTIQENLPCTVFLGKRFYDFLIPGGPHPHIVSERIIRILLENDITGWKATPVRIVDHDELKYYVLMITGRCSGLDLRSGERITVMFPAGRDGKPSPDAKPTPARKGWKFDLNSWDGSDIFLSEGQYIFVTKRVRDLLVKNKATNIVLENLNDVILHEFMFDIFDRKWSS